MRKKNKRATLIKLFDSLGSCKPYLVKLTLPKRQGVSLSFNLIAKVDDEAMFRAQANNTWDLEKEKTICIGNYPFSQPPGTISMRKLTDQEIKAISDIKLRENFIKGSRCILAWSKVEGFEAEKFLDRLDNDPDFAYLFLRESVNAVRHLIYACEKTIAEVRGSAASHFRCLLTQLIIYGVRRKFLKADAEVDQWNNMREIFSNKLVGITPKIVKGNEKRAEKTTTRAIRTSCCYEGFQGLCCFLFAICEAFKEDALKRHQGIVRECKGGCGKLLRTTIRTKEFCSSKCRQKKHRNIPRDRARQRKCRTNKRIRTSPGSRFYGNRQE